MSKKSRKFEPKKTINISLQSKKYYKTINDILEEWDNNDLQASTEVCESIIWANKFNKSITLVGIVNAYNTAEKMIELYSAGRKVDNLDEKLEAILSSAISIDMNKLIEAVKEQCSNKPSSNIKTNIEKKTISAPVLKEEPLEIEKPLEIEEPVEIEKHIQQHEEAIKSKKEYNSTKISAINEQYPQHEVSVAQDEIVEEHIDEDDKYAYLSTDFLFNS